MNYLSKNIRFLRKQKKWSQEELAGKLDVKRSSIAAYESKNVRPRLDFIVGFSKLFNITMSDLIEKDLQKIAADDGIAQPGKTANAASLQLNGHHKLDIDDMESVKKFVERSVRIRKMLEGFKVFYRFKLENIESMDPVSSRLAADIENFLLLMEHLVAHNEALIKAVSEQNRPSSDLN